MKCFTHHGTEAVAVCAYCGRAVCADCVQSPAAPRICCSIECGTALTRADEALRQLSAISHQLLQQSVQSAQASAFYCYLTAGLSAGAAVAAWFMLPSPFLIYFTGACALVLFAAGYWYGRVAWKQALDL